MARFVAGSRFARLLAVGGVIAIGWLLGLIFGFTGAASAETHIPAGHATAVEAEGTARVSHRTNGAEVTTPKAPRDAAATPHVATGPASAGGFPTVSDTVSADAVAMAGRSVDGLTSQSKPAPAAPSAADHSAGADGFVPRSGSGPSGPGIGDVARSVFDPRLVASPAFTARVPAPVVRAAADDPSFSPD
ncbi:hypothetical protein [Sphaerisporangium krabiense]|uniref:Uncharacterized protein n=1 Tax=Sphaerisporangium krabiense TaxID=763782 RepID=A0A7W9DNV1_9ACTN|nr:hypothetical protein [Sphaerisporangium krabiense]MBB5625806.1 hypothetical protein [Sphaerisporangium krabiense]